MDSFSLISFCLNSRSSLALYYVILFSIVTVCIYIYIYSKKNQMLKDKTPLWFKSAKDRGGGGGRVMRGRGGGRVRRGRGGGRVRRDGGEVGN